MPHIAKAHPAGVSLKFHWSETSLLVYLEYFMERLLETTIKANAMALMYCYFLGQDSPSSNIPGSSED